MVVIIAGSNLRLSFCLRKKGYSKQIQMRGLKRMYLSKMIYAKGILPSEYPDFTEIPHTYI
jgi:hypothetical protein